ncbi:hypothetical protein D1970_04305 [Mesobacillus zeae]|uniref:Uncharacterized protein n=1 Tax=Mesobacillus zeae TaxID=1917180 RepID=A0A398BL17_9BACI|nr:hypothetical protein D1970_04305 [Mesobacillus zeae]
MCIGGTKNIHRNKKSESSLRRGDKHKTSRREGRSLTFLTDWLMNRSPKRCSWTKKSESAR